jgi:signal transduction histidine kinase
VTVIVRVAPTVRYTRLPTVVAPVVLEDYRLSAVRQIPRLARLAYPGCGMRDRLRVLLRRPASQDVGLAVLLAALSVLAAWRLINPAGASAVRLGSDFGSPQLLHWRAAGWLAAIAVELGALTARRRFPLTVLAVTLGMATTHALLLPIMPVAADLAVAIAVYTVASARPRPVSISATVAAVALAAGLNRLLLAMAAPGASSQKTLATTWQVADMALPVLVLAAAWLAGEGAKTRRSYIAEVEGRAADAEHDLGMQSELAAAAERERITRELHDVIAHALSVMVIQAQGAGSALRRSEATETTQALEAIVTTGRGALAETRRVLGVVRQPAGAAPELAPQPGLGDVAALADQVRRAGTPVQLHVTGAVRRLADGIELSAYRIVQEALTNTMKHGGPGATAVVGVYYAGTELIIEITDDGGGQVRGERFRRPAATDNDRVTSSRGGEGTRRLPEGTPGARCAGGHGLAGMRARVAMLGGELAAGPRKNSAGFRVRARLPVAAGALPAHRDVRSARSAAEPLSARPGAGAPRETR